VSRLNIQYQQRDLDFNDYNMQGFRLKNGDFVYFRDLDIDLLSNTEELNNSFSVIGPAFSLGCHTNDTFGDLLARETNLNCINFSLQGSSASTYLLDEFSEIIDKINSTKFCIVSVFSGRSVANSEFQHSGDLFTFEKLVKKGTNSLRPAHKLYEEYLEANGEEAFENLVGETVENYHESIRRLYSKIKVPIVTLWFSKRPPSKLNLSAKGNIFKKMGMFPHFLGEDTAEFLKEVSDYYVESVCADGTPQLLFDRWDGYIASVTKSSDYGYTESKYNLYYASPMMHHAAFNNIRKGAHELIDNSTSTYHEVKVTKDELTQLFNELYVPKFLSLNKKLLAYIDDYFFNAMSRSYEDSEIDYAPFWPFSSSKNSARLVRNSDLEFSLTIDRSISCNNSSVWAYLLSKSRKFHQYLECLDQAKEALDSSNFLNYAILTTPRSGSTMLSSMLANGGLGKPREHFRQASATLLNNYELFGADPDEVLDFLRYFGAVEHDNGYIFGTKLISHFVQDLEYDLLAKMNSCDFKFIYLKREDEAAQVTSILRARKSNFWHAHSNEQATKERKRLTSEELISLTTELEVEKVYNDLRDQKAFIDKKIESLNIVTLDVSYEALTSENRNIEVQAISKHLGIDELALTEAEADTVRIGSEDRFYEFVKSSILKIT